MVPVVPLTPSLVPDTNTEGVKKKLSTDHTVDFGKEYVIIQIMDNCPKISTLHSVCVDSASKPGKKPSFGPV